MPLRAVKSLTKNRAFLFKLFTIGHFSLSWFTKLTTTFAESINIYCMTSALYIVLTLILEVLFDTYNSTLLNGICLFLSALLTKIIPDSMINYWSYGVTLFGITYRIMEGPFLMNMSFKVSRKLRAKFDEQVTKEAIFLLTSAIVEFLLGLLVSYNIYMNLDHASPFVKLMFVAQMCSSAFLLVGTMAYAGNDCTINNAMFYFLMSSFKLYTFYLFSNYMNLNDMNFSVLLLDYVKRM